MNIALGMGSDIGNQGIHALDRGFHLLVQILLLDQHPEGPLALIKALSKTLELNGQRIEARRGARELVDPIRQVLLLIPDNLFQVTGGGLKIPGGAPDIILVGP